MKVKFIIFNNKKLKILGVGKKTLLNTIKKRYQINNLYTSFLLSKQSLSYISEKEDDTFDCIPLFFLINLVKSNKELIICLRLYNSDLSKNFLVNPQAFFLLYDLTSKDTFDILLKYYDEITNDKKYTNAKYILIGNKIDLIENEQEKDKNQIKANEKNEENKENEKNAQVKNRPKENIELVQINNINYYKQAIKKDNFDLIKDISGLNGFNLEDLLIETAFLLYKYVKNMEDAKSSLYQTEGDSIFIDNKLDINKRQKSYHDMEYKKEVNKINKQNNRICCLVCNIF